MIFLVFNFLTYLLILITSLLIGGKGFNSIISLDSCSNISWFLMLLTQILVFLISSFIFKKYTSKSSGKNQIDFLKIGSLSYLTGILSGSLGVGGGIIINPILLELGYHPAIASTISSYLVLFTSLSTTTQFLIVGAFDLHYALYIFLFSAIGSFLGNFIILKIMRKYDRPSIIVWILFLLLLLSTFILPPVGIFKLMNH